MPSVAQTRQGRQTDSLDDLVVEPQFDAPVAAMLNAAAILVRLLHFTVDDPELYREIQQAAAAITAEVAGMNEGLAARIRAGTPNVERAFQYDIALYQPGDPRLSKASTDQLIGEIVRRGACRAVLADLIARGRLRGVRIE